MTVRRRLLVGLAAVVAVAAAASGWVFAMRFASRQPSPNVPVSERPITLEPRTLTSTVTFNATIGYVPLAVAATAQSPGIVTGLPSVGTTVSQGQPIFQINGAPVILLYGAVPEWRSLTPGVPPGSDVAELEHDLNQLGYAGRSPLPGNGIYSAAVQAAVERFLAASGLPASPSLLQGTVLFLPGPVVVSKLLVPLGASVGPSEPLLDVSSTRRVVTGSYSPSGGPPVAAGQPASVSPDDGGPALLGSVATVTSTGGGSSVTVAISLSGSPALPAGSIPALATVTTRTLHNVLAVPVQALVALVNGGYALEVLSPSGRHHLVGVSIGASGDSNLVQVTGRGIRAGLRVLVPTLY